MKYSRIQILLIVLFSFGITFLFVQRFGTIFKWVTDLLSLLGLSGPGSYCSGFGIKLIPFYIFVGLSVVIIFLGGFLLIFRNLAKRNQVTKALKIINSVFLIAFFSIVMFTGIQIIDLYKNVLTTFSDSCFVNPSGLACKDCKENGIFSKSCMTCNNAFTNLCNDLKKNHEQEQFYSFEDLKDKSSIGNQCN